MIKRLTASVRDIFTRRPPIPMAVAPSSRERTQLTCVQKPLALHLGKTPDAISGEFFVSEENLSSHHMTLLGGTGSGKTNLAQAWIRQLIDAQRGCCFLDPKGDAVEDILAYIARKTRERGSDAILKRVHLLEPRIDSVFGFDQFSYEPDPELPAELQTNAYRAWLHRTVDSIRELLHRNEGETEEGHPRLTRILGDVLMAVGTAIDDTGKHLSLADSIVLLDVLHPRHMEVYLCVASHLPSDVRADFEAIHQLNRQQDILAQTEGALNRLRRLLSPIMKAIVAETVKTIDFRRVIKERQILLVNLAETRYFSRTQTKVLGNLVIHALVEAAATMPRRDRTRFTMFVDECEDYMNETLNRALKMGRGWQLSVVLMSQNLSSFCKGDLDLVDTVLNEPGTVAVFNTKVFDDRLIELIGYPNIDYTRYVQEVDRPDGVDWVWTPTIGNNQTVQHSRQSGGSRTVGGSVTKQRGTAHKSEQSSSQSVSDNKTTERSLQQSVGQQVSQSVTATTSASRAQSLEAHRSETSGTEIGITHGEDRSISAKVGKMRTKQDTQSMSTSDSLSRETNRGFNISTPQHGNSTIQTNIGDNSGTSFSSSQSNTESSGKSLSTEIGEGYTERESEKISASRAHTDGTSVGTNHTFASGHQLGQSVADTTSDTVGIKAGVGRSISRQEGVALATTESSTMGTTTSSQEGENWSRGQTVGQGQSQSLSLTAVAKHRVELQERPELQTAVADQFHVLKTQLSTLQCGACLIRCYGDQRTKFLQVRYIAPAFEDPDEFFAAIDEVRAKLDAIHSYRFVPDLSHEAEERRLTEYIGDLAIETPAQKTNGQRIRDRNGEGSQPRSRPRRRVQRELPSPPGGRDVFG